MNRNRRHRPKRNWRLLRQRILCIMRPLLIAAAAGTLLIGLNRALDIERVHVLGADKALAQIIQQNIAKHKPLDFWHSRPARIRNQLLRAIPDLADVRVRRVLPHTLAITPKRRQPLALWQDRNRRIQLVDAAGVAYRPIRSEDLADLPLLRCGRAQLGEAIGIILILQHADRRRLQSLSECIALHDSWQLNFDKRQRWLLPSHAPAQRLVRVLALLDRKRWRQGLWRLDARSPSRWFIRHALHGGMI